MSVIFSLSISLRASPVSHFFIITTFLPTRIDNKKATWLPVAWNNGTHNKIDESPLANEVLSLPNLFSLSLRTEAIKAQLNIEDISPLWVERTPFGLPVDPEV